MSTSPDPQQTRQGDDSLVEKNNAVGLSELLQQMGIQRQSLYNTFGCKHALFLEAVQHYGQKTVCQIKGHLNQPGSPLENLRRVFRKIATDQTDSDHEINNGPQHWSNEFYASFKEDRKLEPNRKLSDMASLQGFLFRHIFFLIVGTRSTHSCVRIKNYRPFFFSGNRENSIIAGRYFAVTDHDIRTKRYLGGCIGSFKSHR